MIFIDVSVFIHKYVIAIRRKGSDINDDEGNIISHIYAIKKLVEQFLRLNILPICVFDGKSPEIKQETIEKRKEATQDAIAKCYEIKEKNNEEYIKHFKRSFYISRSMMEECKEFLDDCGLPYITSLTEADPQCAGMAHYYQHYSAGTYSEDSDILMYGGSELLRDLDLNLKTISIIKLEDILSFLQDKADDICKKNNKDCINITRKIFTDFSMIMGNDYCNGIRCCGGNNRDKLFEIFIICDCNVEIFVNTLHRLNKASDKDYIIQKYYIPTQFLQKYNETKDIYNNIEIYEPSLINLKINKPNIKKINDYVIDYKIKPSMINNLINSLTKIHIIFNKILLDIISNKAPYDHWQTANSKKKNKI